MNGTPSILSSHTRTTAYPLIFIVNVHSCSIKICGSTKPTPFLTTHNFLYVTGFPTNLLSMSTITHTLNCVFILYPFHYVFQDLHTSQSIGLGYVRSMSLCGTPLPLGFLPCFLALLLLLLLFCGIINLATLGFINLRKHYHGYLNLSLCASHVKWANIIVRLTLLVTPFHPPLASN